MCQAQGKKGIYLTITALLITLRSQWGRFPIGFPTDWSQWFGNPIGKRIGFTNTSRGHNVLEIHFWKKAGKDGVGFPKTVVCAQWRMFSKWKTHRIFSNGKGVDYFFQIDLKISCVLQFGFTICGKRTRRERVKARDNCNFFTISLIMPTKI